MLYVQASGILLHSYIIMQLIIANVAAQYKKLWLFYMNC